MTPEQLKNLVEILIKDNSKVTKSSTSKISASAVKDVLLKMIDELKNEENITVDQNVQRDWSENDKDEDSYIKNKPDDIPDELEVDTEDEVLRLKNKWKTIDSIYFSGGRVADNFKLTFLRTRFESRRTSGSGPLILKREIPPPVGYSTRDYVAGIVSYNSIQFPGYGNKGNVRFIMTNSILKLWNRISVTTSTDQWYNDGNKNLQLDIILIWKKK